MKAVAPFVNVLIGSGVESISILILILMELGCDPYSRALVVLLVKKRIMETPSYSFLLMHGKKRLLWFDLGVGMLSSTYEIVTVDRDRILGSGHKILECLLSIMGKKVIGWGF